MVVDLKACIRYCQLSEESQVEALYKYRDMYFKIMQQQGKEVDYREFQCIDIWYENLKATYSFLEEREYRSQYNEKALLASLKSFETRYSFQAVFIAPQTAGNRKLSIRLLSCN